MIQGLTILFLAGAGLTGCGAGSGPEHSVAFGEATALVVPEALDRAGQQFFGPPSAGRPSPGLAGLDRRLLRSDSEVAFRQTGNLATEIRTGWRGVVHDGPGARLSLVPSVGLGASRVRYVLPEGIGVFVDPMEVGIASVTLSPQLLLRAEGPVATLPGLRVEGFAGGGALIGESRTRLRSALIAVNSRAGVTLPYLTAGASIRYGKAALGLSVTGRKGEAVVTHLGLDIRK